MEFVLSFCTNLDIAANNNFVYVTFDYDIGVYYAMSDNYGRTFSTMPMFSSNVTEFPDQISNPTIAVSDNHVYVGWTHGKEVKIRDSHNNGYSFNPILTLPLYGVTNPDDLLSLPPQSYNSRLSIVAKDNIVYYSTGFITFTSGPYLVGRSDNYGDTFETILLLNDVKSMSLTNNTLYVLALKDVVLNRPPIDFNIKLFKSSDNGTSFEQVSFLPADVGSYFFDSYFENEKIDFLYSIIGSNGAQQPILATSTDGGKVFNLIALPFQFADPVSLFVVDRENNLKHAIMFDNYEFDSTAELKLVSIKEDNCHINHQDPNCPNSKPIAISTVVPNPAIVDQHVILDATHSSRS